MADLRQQASEWIRSHPEATLHDIWVAGYLTSTDNWCSKKR